MNDKGLHQLAIGYFVRSIKLDFFPVVRFPKDCLKTLHCTLFTMDMEDSPTLNTPSPEQSDSNAAANESFRIDLEDMFKLYDVR